MHVSIPFDLRYCPNVHINWDLCPTPQSEATPCNKAALTLNVHVLHIGKGFESAVVEEGSWVSLGLRALQAHLAAPPANATYMHLLLTPTNPIKHSHNGFPAFTSELLA